MKALGVGVAVAVLTFLGEFVTQINFGQWDALVMGVIPPAVAFAIRFLRDNNAE